MKDKLTVSLHLIINFLSIFQEVFQDCFAPPIHESPMWRDFSGPRTHCVHCEYPFGYAERARGKSFLIDTVVFHDAAVCRS